MEAQAAAEAHLAACMVSLFAEEEGTDEEAPESPASAPFCGCETCLVREALVGAWKVVDAYCEDAVAEALRERVVVPCARCGVDVNVSMECCAACTTVVLREYPSLAEPVGD